MAGELSSLEYRLLSYLRESASTSPRVGVDIYEVARRLGVSVDEAEEALLRLAEGEYLKIVKAPPTEKAREYCLSRFVKLITDYMEGRISQKEYLDKWAELRSTAEGAGAPLGIFPREPAQVREIMPSLVKNIQALQKLDSESATLHPEVYERLRAEYNESLLEVAKTLKAILLTIGESCRKLEERIRELENELKAIEVDEKIRNIDRTADKQRTKAKIEDTRKTIATLLSLLQPHQAERQRYMEEAEKIKATLTTLQQRHELVSARAMIEGNPRLQEEANKLEKQINQLKQQLATLQATLTQAKPATPEELATLITDIAEKPPSTITQETLTQLKEINAILQRIKTYQTT